MQKKRRVDSTNVKFNTLLVSNSFYNISISPDPAKYVKQLLLPNRTKCVSLLHHTPGCLWSRSIILTHCVFCLCHGESSMRQINKSLFCPIIAFL